MRHLASPAAFLIGLGFQVSGYQNIYAAYVFWALGALLFLLFSAGATWRFLRARFGRSSRSDEGEQYLTLEGQRYTWRQIAELPEGEQRRFFEKHPGSDQWYQRQLSDAMGPPGRIGEPWPDEQGPIRFVDQVRALQRRLRDPHGAELRRILGLLLKELDHNRTQRFAAALETHYLDACLNHIRQHACEEDNPELTNALEAVMSATKEVKFYAEKYPKTTVRNLFESRYVPAVESLRNAANRLLETS